MSDDSTPFPWEYLDLEGPSPDKDIRKAYARKLKALDQRTDPERFQALRQAYEAARKMAPTTKDFTTRATKRSSEKRVKDGKVGEKDNIPEKTQNWQEPIQVEPVNALSVTPDRTDAVEDYRILSTKMESMVEADDYDIRVWTGLLNDPVLHDLAYARNFEYALVNCLALKGPFGGEPDNPPFSAPKDWVELIESRYGWVADGLKFDQRFPGNNKLYTELRQALDIHVKSESKATSTPIEQTFYGVFMFNLVFQPWLAWLTLFGVSAIWYNIVEPADPSAFNNPLTLTSAAFFATVCVALRCEKLFSTYSVTRQGLSRFGLEVFSSYLIGIKIIPAAITLLVWVFALSMILILFLTD